MKQQTLVSFAFLLILIAGCKNNPTPIARTGEGTITYSVSYPDSENLGLKATLLPSSITLIFKDGKAVFIASAGFGMIQLVNLLNYEEKRYTSLLIDQIRQNYGCKLTPEEIQENETNPYDIEATNETKMIAGIKANKAIVKDIGNNTSFPIYYDNEIKFYYWNSPFKNFNYLFLEYTHTINHLTMKLVATKVDLSTPVDTSLFEIKGNYEWLNQKDFYAHLSEL